MHSPQHALSANVFATLVETELRKSFFASMDSINMIESN